MSDRDKLIKAEIDRQAAHEKLIAELRERFDAISAPVLQFKKIEDEMREISQRLQQASGHNSALHAAFMRDLPKAASPELLQLVGNAKLLIGQQRTLGRVAPAEIHNLANIREWVTDVEQALANPAVDSKSLETLQHQGEALLDGQELVSAHGPVLS